MLTYTSIYLWENTGDSLTSSTRRDRAPPAKTPFLYLAVLFEVVLSKILIHHRKYAATLFFRA